MTMIEIIRGICAYPQRGACTESERKASRFVFDTMEAEGFAPRFYDFETWPDFYKVYAVHFILAVALGALACAQPALSLIGLAFVIVSFYGDLTTRWYWLRRLFGKGRSRHVIGTLGPQDAKRTLVFSGHHDAGQTSFIFKPESIRRQTRFFKKYNTTWAQYILLMIGLCLIFQFAFLSLLQTPGPVPEVLYGIGAVICIVGAVLHLSMWGKGFAGGANDNAAGVATAMEIGRRLKDRMPDDTRIIVLSFGAEETMMAGSGTTVKEMFADQDPEHFYVINFEGTGGGTIRYSVGEGMIDVYAYDPELIAAAKKAKRELGLETMKPFTIRSGGTDALPFVVNGFKAITLFGLDEDDYPPHYHWHTDLPDAIDEATLEQSVTVALAMIKHLD